MSSNKAFFQLLGFCFIFFFSHFQLFGQKTAVNNVFQREFEQVVRIANKMHPQTNFNEKEWKLPQKTVIKHPDTLWKYLALQLNKFECGHTFVHLPDFRRRENVKLLPGYFFAKDKKLYFSMSDTENCYELEEIENIPADKIYTELIKVARKQRIAERDLSEKFALYFHLIYGINKDYFEIKVKNFAEKRVFPHIVFEEWIKTHAEKYQKNLTWKYIETSKTVVLEIPDFFFEENVISSQMPELLSEWEKKSVKSLVIDLRENLGGSMRTAEKLFSFLCSDTVTLKKKSYLKSMIFEDSEYLSQISTRPYGAVLHQKVSALLARNFSGNEQKGYESREGYYTQSTVIPESKTFNGEIVVLVSRETYSAAEHFCRLLKKSKRGKLAGEKTGGTAKTLQADIVLTYTLSHSHISFDLPLIRIEFLDFDEDSFSPEINIRDKSPCKKEEIPFELH